MPMPPRRLLAAACAALLSAGPATAADPAYWVHDAPLDWADATLDGAVVTGFGEIVPARRLESVALPSGAAVQIVHALASMNGANGQAGLFAATGPGGVLLRVEGDAATATELPDIASLLSLASLGDALLVGTGGEAATLLRVALDGQVQAAVDLPGARYAWAIATLPDGAALVGTGPNAALYRVAGDAAEAVFEAAGETHVQAVAVGGGRVYVGTTPGGIVWELDPADDFAPRVLYDAAEPEVTALLFDGASLWVLTAAEGDESLEPDGAPARALPPLGDAAGLADDVLPEIELPEIPGEEPDPLPLQDELDPPAAAPEAEPEAELQAEPEAGVATADRFATGTAGFEEGSGSALYRIDLADDRRGVVTGVLRDAALLFAIARLGDLLYLAAGATAEQPARVIRLDAATGETAVVALPAGRQATALHVAGDALVVGLSNPGGLARLAEAGEGTLTSGVLDAGSVARFGTIRLVGRQPAGTRVTLQARSGMTSDPGDAGEPAAGWSDWSAPVEAKRFNATDLPPGRFFQYRLGLAANDAGAVPAIERVTIAYQRPNRPPAIGEVAMEGEATGLTPAEVADAAMAGGQSLGSVRSVSWEASDPDGDALVYSVRVRRGRSGPFETIASDLTDSAYAWDTRATGEGVYEVQVVASDARANPGDAAGEATRVTPPFRVDLTPPQIGDVSIENGTISFRVADTGGAVARVEFLAGTDPTDPAAWRRAVPDDGLSDSPSERFSLPRDTLPDGASAVLRVRAVDDGGNIAYTSFPLPARE